MKKYIQNERGFTLIEMLLVLFIVMIVSSIVFQISFKLSEKQVINHFFKQIQFDLQRMQSLAIETGETTMVIFVDNNTYIGYQDFGEVVFEKSFPPGVELNKYSNLKKIHYNSKGEVIKFGTVMFHTINGEKSLIINIEKGRVKLVE